MCKEYLSYDDKESPKDLRLQAINDNNIQNSSNKTTYGIKQKIKLLLVDDEPVCRLVVSLILMNSKYELIEVKDGVEAINYLKSDEGKEIDIIMLDLMMPDITGRNVLQYIKQDARLTNIPVLIQTAIHDDLEIQKCLNLGAAGFMRKPFNKIDLLRKLDSICG